MITNARLLSLCLASRCSAARAAATDRRRRRRPTPACTCTRPTTPTSSTRARIDFTNAKLPKFALGATYVTARFKGVGVSVLLKDEHRYGKWRNYYDADHRRHGRLEDPDQRRRRDVSRTRSRPTCPTASTRSRSSSGPSPTSASATSAASRSRARSCRRPTGPRTRCCSSAIRSPPARAPRCRTAIPGCTADELGPPVENADVAYGPGGGAHARRRLPRGGRVRHRPRPQLQQRSRDGRHPRRCRRSTT